MASVTATATARWFIPLPRGSNTMSAKRTYSIPVIWSMVGTMEVEAENLQEALDAAAQAPLPTDGDYLEDSFEIDFSEIQYYNDISAEEKAQIWK